MRGIVGLYGVLLGKPSSVPVSSSNSGDRLPGFAILVALFPSLQPWPSHLTSLGLNFFIFIIEVIIVLTISSRRGA